MLHNALIGYTGFVGSTLARNCNFQTLYNSKNISDIEGRSFDTVICAGVSAVKWRANKEPEADRSAITALSSYLSTIKAKTFILISTVDVYSNPIDVDETNEPTLATLQPYGRHRLEFEQFVKRTFSGHKVVRLPGLFGNGLRKNLIFDFLNHNQVQKIVPNGQFQWYPMRRFAKDLSIIKNSDLSTVNISVEPILTRELQDRVFPKLSIGEYVENAPRYDMQTIYASLLSGQGRYHVTKSEMLEELYLYVRSEDFDLR